MRPEVFVVPCVFADGDGQPFSFEINHLLRSCRRKVALFVEYVVKRQQHLVLLQQDLPLVQ